MRRSACGAPLGRPPGTATRAVASVIAWFGGNGHAATSLPGPTERRPADEIEALARPQIRAELLETFATLPSEALQQTLFQMGEAVLSGRPELAEIRLSMPNKDHFLQDLEPFGLDNPKLVYHADDRPYGLI